MDQWMDGQEYEMITLSKDCDFRNSKICLKFSKTSGDDTLNPVLCSIFRTHDTPSFQTTTHDTLSFQTTAHDTLSFQTRAYDTPSASYPGVAYSRVCPTRV